MENCLRPLDRNSSRHFRFSFQPEIKLWKCTQRKKEKICIGKKRKHAWLKKHERVPIFNSLFFSGKNNRCVIIMGWVGWLKPSLFAALWVFRALQTATFSLFPRGATSFVRRIILALQMSETFKQAISFLCKCNFLKRNLRCSWELSAFFLHGKREEPWVPHKSGTFIK